VVPVSQRRILIGVGLLSAGLASGFIGYWATLSTIDNFQRNVETNGIYPIPRGWMIAVMALGFVLSAIEFFRRSYKIFRASDDEIMKRHGEVGVEP
jgi:TRAP-type C4-dicarboxylate transport system permease small subunit